MYILISYILIPYILISVFIYMKGMFSCMQMHFFLRFAKYACAPWISRAGIWKDDVYTMPVPARWCFLFASLKLVFLPERPNTAQRDGQAGAGQRCESLGLMTLEAPATTRRNTRATWRFHDTPDRRFLSSLRFLKCLGLQNWGVLIRLRKERPCHPRAALVPLAL